MLMRMDDAAAILARADFFNMCNDEQRRMLGFASDRRHVEADEVIFQYSRAAKELWKFCNHISVEIAARIIADDPPNVWWERGAPRRR